MLWSPETLETLLLVLALFFFFTWGLEVVLKHRSRWRRSSLIGGLLAAGLLLSRVWFVEPFTVPTASMVPTILVGDLVLVQKFPYRLEWPVTESTMVETGAMRRGDIVVFKLEGNPRIRYVKRLIGLPGDEVVSMGDRWFVNGRPLFLGPDAVYTDPRSGKDSTDRKSDREYLDGHTYRVLDDVPASQLASRRWVVPRGHIFVLGDNRGISKDGRSFGFVEQSRVLGRACRVLVNFKGWDRWGVNLLR